MDTSIKSPRVKIHCNSYPGFLFPKGEIEKPCFVVLEDDAIYEEEEEFRLVLGTPKSTSSFGASIGEIKEVLVKIKDEEDSRLMSYLLFFQLKDL